MPSSSTRARRPAAPARLGTRTVAAGAVVALSVALIWVLSSVSRSPDRLGLTLDNPTEYDVTVAARSADETAVVAIGTVARRSRQRIDGVLDQGDRWVFEFSSGGADGGELAVSRVELEAAGWRLQIPSGVADRLRATGLRPPP
jgi:hypothetical protein